MLGDTVGEVRGQAISTRILSDEGQGPRMEITDQSAGELYGVSVNQTVTYVGVLRPDGTISGQGVGIMPLLAFLCGLSVIGFPFAIILGLVALLALVIYRPNGILVLILVFAAMELWQRWKTRHLAGSGAYYSVLPWQRLTAAISYFGLAALLVLGMHATHVPHTF